MKNLIVIFLLIGASAMGLAACTDTAQTSGTASTLSASQAADTASATEKASEEPSPSPSPSPKEDPVKKYMTDNNITLTARDVQYDMANSLDKNFVIAGEAELSTYFNYGFDDDKNYFSVRITPDGGKFSDYWNLYFDRTNGKQLFDDLKNGNVYIIATGKIPSSMYEDSQDNLALGVQAQWYK